MIKIALALMLAAFSGEAFSANPLNTVNDQLNQPETGGGSGILLIFVILYFTLALWLLISYKSPIHEWVEKNKGMAYFCFIALGPMLLAVISNLFK
ncbi:hypothetical protein AAFN46_20330 [Pseudomonas sp. CAU 1711]|uniref:hypothetical protein n=1 Tax=Pseudomonas sp. CAU 1711 TaxID=3140356 RepID=UPI0032619770